MHGLAARREPLPAGRTYDSPQPRLLIIPASIAYRFDTIFRDRELLARIQTQPNVRKALRRGWILRRQPHEQDGRRFFAARGIFWRQRAAQRRREGLLGIFQPFVLPALGYDGQVAIQLRDRAPAVVTIIRRLPGADLPENAIALPLQAGEFFALGLGAVFADENIPPILKGELLPA